MVPTTTLDNYLQPRLKLRRDDAFDAHLKVPPHHTTALPHIVTPNHLELLGLSQTENNMVLCADWVQRAQSCCLPCRTLHCVDGINVHGGGAPLGCPLDNFFRDGDGMDAGNILVSAGRQLALAGARPAGEERGSPLQISSRTFICALFYGINGTHADVFLNVQDDSGHSREVGLQERKEELYMVRADVQGFEGLVVEGMQQLLRRKQVGALLSVVSLALAC